MSQNVSPAAVVIGDLRVKLLTKLFIKIRNIVVWIEFCFFSIYKDYNLLFLYHEKIQQIF